MNSYSKKFEELLESAREAKLITMRAYRCFKLYLPLDDEPLAMELLEELNETIHAGNRPNLIMLYDKFDDYKFLYHDLKDYIMSRDFSTSEYINLLRIEMDVAAEMKKGMVYYEIDKVLNDGDCYKRVPVTFVKPDVYCRAVKRIQKECPVSYSHFSRSMSFFDKTYPETED